MKRLIFPIAAVLAMGTVSAQNIWPTAVGTMAGVGTTSPIHPLHLHGTTDYIYTPPAPIGGGTPVSVNYGKTSRIGFTNSLTGMQGYDGAIIRLSSSGASSTNFVLENLEGGNIQLNTSGVNLHLIGSNNRAFFGPSTTSTSSIYGRLNISSSTDNGLYINPLAAGFYGLSVKMTSANDNAIQVITPAVTNEFAFFVKNNGQVGIYTNGLPADGDVLVIKNGTQRLLQLENSGLLYAREIKVNTDSWMDVVFEPGYELRPLEEVEAYIEEKGHLPEVPSADEVIKEGINVAEMNRTLLQKVEELTLYIIEQNKKNKEQEIRIAELEQKLK